MRGGEHVFCSDYTTVDNPRSTAPVCKNGAWHRRSSNGLCLLPHSTFAYWAHPTTFLLFCFSAWASLRSAYELYPASRRSETEAKHHRKRETGAMRCGFGSRNYFHIPHPPIFCFSAWASLHSAYGLCLLPHSTFAYWAHPTTFLLFCSSAWARPHSAYEPYLLPHSTFAYWAHPTTFLLFCSSAWAHPQSAYELYPAIRRSET